MSWRFTAVSAALFAAAAIGFGVATVAWRHRDRPAADAALALLAAMGCWSLVDAVRLGFATFSAQLFWYRVGIVAGSAVPPLLLAFALSYAGHEKWLGRPLAFALAVDPLAFAAFVWSNPTHHLVWSDVTLVSSPVPHLSVSLGPAYLVHVAYAYFVVAFAVLVFLRVFWRSSTIYRRQVGLLLVAIAVPLAVNVGFTFGLTPLWHLDLTPLAFTVSGIVFGVALFEFDLLNLTPVARANLISTLGNGLVVVNRDDRVAHANAKAAEIYPSLRIGAGIETALGVSDIADLDGETTAVEMEDGRRFYDVHASNLVDFRDRPVGWLLALQDVTERHEYEQRLVVTNRLLRHNLRNEMNKVVGWASTVRSASDADEGQEAADRIEAVATDVGTLSREARHIQSMLGGGAEHRVDVVDVLGTEVAAVREHWSAADVILDAPSSAPVHAPGESVLKLAVENVLENAVEHNDAPTPRVAVTVECGDRVTVRVADNGPGIPEAEREPLSRGEEDPLRHTSGLGLWLVYWAVENVGGSVSFADRDGGGSVVELSLPSA